MSRAERFSLADKHAPAGLMSDHVHEPGEFMVEYKYMNMFMEDNRRGSRTLSDRDTLTAGQAMGTNFGATPTQMTMEMHMIHFMYGLTEDVTAYAMPMLTSLTMDHIRGPGNPAVGASLTPLFSEFTTHNSGFDDTVFGALWRVHKGCSDELIVNLSFSVPTGELDRDSDAPSAGLMRTELPYPMRRSSGTFDARPGVTYKTYFDHGSLGLQFQTDLPIGRNWDDYSVGEEYRLNAWYSWLLADSLALSYRVEGLWRENFDGADPDLNPMVISTSRPNMRGGEWLNFGYGAMLLLPRGHFLNFEAVHPVHQHLDGIQLEHDWWFNVSWSKAF
jgi:hypothetical protein